MNEGNDYFKLFQFSAKWDPVPTMLTQNHTQLIKGFYGQTTSFKKRVVKPDVVVMGETTAMRTNTFMASMAMVFGLSMADMTLKIISIELVAYRLKFIS